MSLRNKRTIYTMCIGPVMTYESPVFAHALMHYMNCKWYKKNFIEEQLTHHVMSETLHSTPLPTISKFMKDASERFFYIASSHPNPLLVAAVSYEPPPPNLFWGRPRNVPLDPPDDLTIGMEKL
ncbi:hypothetical protein EVAR_61126_1 [Eumeta japonica]|uniref:Uncharacterized protein n=1 Tax=Eumeta variegata TaxID=151549 RepID=A0A4C1ZII4_EUMVA|nr:hypothetical protein EVAR_61126_1 [Eumeta japonica]